MKEHDVGIKHKKSALEKFDEKYVIEGIKTRSFSLEYFKDNYLLSLRIL